mmetsp:Transcript_31686/g.66633  ORF Transcript_31686/g.66633 Transcript_31686/m.66633 type:complete len:149 (+) Transcript_31686:106-552(+)
MVMHTKRVTICTIPYTISSQPPHMHLCVQNHIQRNVNMNPRLLRWMESPPLQYSQLVNICSFFRNVTPNFCFKTVDSILPVYMDAPPSLVMNNNRSIVFHCFSPSPPPLLPIPAKGCPGCSCAAIPGANSNENAFQPAYPINIKIVAN